MERMLMMDGDPIRILVVDDTVSYRIIIRDILDKFPGVEVVGTAANGKIALEKVERLHPDLMTLDLEMPEVDGLEVLRRLKEMRSPVGAIMLSASTGVGAKSTLEALHLGAFDFVLKPASDDLAENRKTLRRHLHPKVEAFARTLRPSQPQADRSSRPSASKPRTTRAKRKAKTDGLVASMNRLARGRAAKPAVVAIGISTGGPQALSTMLPMIPADFDLPILIVQHMPAMFTRSMADSLNDKCAIIVCEAEDGQPVQGGWIYIAPGGLQMKVQRTEEQPVIKITKDPPENSCRPSVDYLFRSVAHTYGANAVGVIMTGMGNDGSLGCRLMKRNGAAILAQNEETCVVFGMPSFPIEEGLADVVAPLDRMADEIVGLCLGRQGAAICR